MRIREIYYHSKFEKKLRRIETHFSEIMDMRLIIFRNNCFDARLETHKLHGKLKGLYSFSISHSHRLIFSILKKGVAGFIDIGDHSIYE